MFTVLSTAHSHEDRTANTGCKSHLKLRLEDQTWEPSFKGYGTPPFIESYSLHQPCLKLLNSNVFDYSLLHRNLFIALFWGPNFKPC